MKTDKWIELKRNIAILTMPVTVNTDIYSLLIFKIQWKEIKYYGDYFAYAHNKVHPIRLIKFMK